MGDQPIAVFLPTQDNRIETGKYIHIPKETVLRDSSVTAAQGLTLQ
jgi:hypothetical protein